MAIIIFLKLLWAQNMQSNPFQSFTTAHHLAKTWSCMALAIQLGIIALFFTFEVGSNMSLKI
jgi:hypothetical protein